MPWTGNGTAPAYAVDGGGKDGSYYFARAKYNNECNNEWMAGWYNPAHSHGYFDCFGSVKTATNFEVSSDFNQSCNFSKHF